LLEDGLGPVSHDDEQAFDRRRSPGPPPLPGARARPARAAPSPAWWAAASCSPGALEPVAHRDVLRAQIEPRRLRLELQERCEIAIDVAVPDQRLDDLADQRGDGHGDFALAGLGQAEVEVL